jgi:putative DNA primase/helicase
MTTTAALLPVLAHVVPAELKGCRAWVGWKQITRNGKPTKVPINPDMGSFAEADAPSTWGTFAQARERQRKDHLAGVGFVFSPNDPFAGIDFDKCRDPETGALNPEVRAMIGLLDSYSEVSPSGTGAKVIIRAALPGSRNRTTRIEMYDRLRFFTMTGHLLPGSPPTINDRQPQLNQLYRRIFGDVTTHDSPGSLGPIGECGTEGGTLWQWAYPRLTPHMMRTANGDDSRYEQDASRADAGLCAALVALGLTRAEVAAAFRSSPRAASLEARKDTVRLDYLIEHAVNAAVSFVGEGKVL